MNLRRDATHLYRQMGSIDTIHKPTKCINNYLHLFREDTHKRVLVVGPLRWLGVVNSPNHYAKKHFFHQRKEKYEPLRF